MARHERGVEWLDRATNSRYPLMPTASATDISSVFSIPNDFFASLYIAIPADLLLDPAYVYISKITHTTTLTLIRFSARVNGDEVEIARADVSRAELTPQISQFKYGLVNLIGIPPYEDIRGRLTIGGLDNLLLQPQGEFFFNHAGAGIEPDAIRPTVRQLQAVEVQNGSSVIRLSGTVRLRPGVNTRFRVVSEEGFPVLYIDALDTAGLNEQLECDFGISPPIRRINGLSGDSQRHVELVGSRCAEIETGQNAVFLRNRCSEPCVACDEAEAVQRLIDPFSQQIPTLVNIVNRLDIAITQTQLNVLSSQGRLQSCDPAT